MRHTPGPWDVNTKADGTGRFVIHDGIGRLIAIVSHTADARLIAAAPEMLEVITRLVNEGAYDDQGDYVLPHPDPVTKEEDYLDHPAIQAARALLARITSGEEK